MLDPKIKERMIRRLRFLYGEAEAPGLVARIEERVGRNRARRAAGPGPWSERDALLITYADTLQGEDRPLRILDRFLRERVGDLVTFLHLLPFYPYSSDDGFAVQDFRAVRPELGDWADIARLAERYRLVFDGVINHVSASSAYMRGYAAGDPAYDGFFISPPPDADTSSVLRTRNLPLLHEYRTVRGTERLWTTFSRDQVDLNYANPRVLLEILDVLLFYAEKGASVIRLDAVPYLWKELGTSCAHLPQTHEVIKLLRDVLDAACTDVLLLTETNVPHQENVAYFGDCGDEAQMAYNFCLPPLVLLSLVTQDASRLTAWARGLEPMSPRATYLNITATHDGIGMRPTEGLLTEAERSVLLDLARARGGDVTGKRNPDGTVSPYELNLSYFDAVNDPRRAEPLDRQVARFMLSQGIPMSLMGIPGVYVHSLLGSRNDLEGVRRTGRARSINRAQLRLPGLEAELAKPVSVRGRVFTAYAHLLRTRRAERAFHPDAGQEGLDLGPAFFAVKRTSRETGESVLALHNVTEKARVVDVGAFTAPTEHLEIVSGRSVPAGALRSLRLAPLEVCWLKPRPGRVARG